MTSANDDLGEMTTTRRIDDATADALLAGRSVPPDLEPVAAALRALRSVGSRPVEPSPELAHWLTAGPPAEPPAEPSPAHTGRAAGRRVRVAVRLVAAGMGVGLVGAGGAGFAGSLPAPVQERFEMVVESVTPYRFPSPAGDPGGPGHDEPAGDVGERDPADVDPGGAATAPEAGGSGAPGPGAGDPGVGDSGGAGPAGVEPPRPGGPVGEDAGGGADGQDVSDRARERGGEGRAGDHAGEQDRADERDRAREQGRDQPRDHGRGRSADAPPPRHPRGAGRRCAR